ncbi:alpha/beta hydrolase [uncultured Roseobacter sp.]|uniref:alpha/beta fold hydrolase n=1 Tax=uncultured Roseobacter sp. TaxID=114847 RepID=UPI0026058CA7|nr:alpha/beta hydrolase [uncultured Roseobacter sp.]
MLDKTRTKPNLNNHIPLAAPPRLRAPAQNKTVEADGISFAYRLMGPEDDVPLVFCQRFRGTMDEWDPAFLEALALHRRLIIFDNIGISSTTGTVPTEVTGQAEAAASFIRALGFNEVDLLGFSMGGYVCQALAILEPSLVRRVILCGSSCPGSAETEPPEEIFFATATKPKWDFEDKVILFYADSSDSRGRGHLAEDRIEQQLAVGAEPEVPEPQWKNLVQIIESFSAPDSPWFARLKEINQPTLIMNGDRDPCYPLQNQLLLHREIPNSRLAILPMAGHAPQHQFPSETASMILDFLRAE